MSNVFSKYAKNNPITRRESTPGSEYAEASLDEVVNSKTFDIQFLRLSQIETNPMNETFTQDGIDELKESIIENGLLHNLVVIYDNETDKYRLISGERRFHAIESMTDEERKRACPKGIPCKVEDPNLSKEEEKLKLMAANIDTRTLTPLQRNETIRLMNDILSEKKARGEKVSLRKEVAEAFGVTDRQAGKIINIQRNLSDELMERHENGEISLTDADKFAMLSPEAQDYVNEHYESTGSGFTKEEYDELRAKDEAKAEALRNLQTQISEKAAALVENENERAKLKADAGETKAQIKVLNSAGVSTTDEDKELKKLQRDLIERKNEKEREERAKKKLEAQLKEVENRKVTLEPEDKEKAAKAEKFAKKLNSIETASRELSKLKKYVKIDENTKKKMTDIVSILNTLLNS